MARSIKASDVGGLVIVLLFVTTIWYMTNVRDYCSVTYAAEFDAIIYDKYISKKFKNKKTLAMGDSGDPVIITLLGTDDRYELWNKVDLGDRIAKKKNETVYTVYKKDGSSFKVDVFMEGCGDQLK